MNRILTRTLAGILCLELVLAPAVPSARAVTGVIGAGGKVAARELEREKRTAAEKQIDTALEAEKYISATLTQNKMFSEQCMTPSGEIDPKRAFMLSDDVAYADMNVKNCAQEREKLHHMNRVAGELVDEFEIDPEKTQCENCSVPQNLQKNEQEFIPPGEACSLEAQARFKKEPCNTYCLWKPAISAVTTGMGPLLVSAFTGGNDGCPKQNLLKSTASCAMNMIKGLIKGIWEAITGLAKLVWEGLKWCAKKVKQGVKWLFWDAWVKTENKTSTNAHAVSQANKKEVESYEKDKRGWLKRKFDAILGFLKELVYVGLFERESKCMNCAQKGQLMCEIGGRVASDLVGFTFTMGAGYAAVKTAVTKFGPKVADLIAKTSKVLPKMGKQGKNVVKVAGETLKKPVKWAGKTAIKVTKPLSKTVVKGWNSFKSSKAYQLIMKPDYSRALDGVKTLSTRAANSVPGKILIAPVRGVKNAFKSYMEFDNLVFQKGAMASANTFRTAGIGMSKTEIARMYLDLSEKSKAVEGAARVDKKGNQVLRVSPDDLSNEQIAQFKRAGVRLDEISADGEIILRVPKATFQELKSGKYATQVNSLGIPIGSDGTVVIKQGATVVERKVSEITPTEFAKLRDSGAVFTTKDHPRAMVPLDPNGLASQGAKVGNEGEIVIKNTDTGEIQVLDASQVTVEEINLYKKKGYPITNLKDPEWNRPVSKAGLPDGDELNHTASAKMHDLRKSGRGEEATKISLQEVESLKVLKESGEISGSSQAAKTRLAQGGKIKTSQLDGIHESRALETTFLPEKNSIQFEVKPGEVRELPIRKNASVVVETYQDGKMAVVRDLERGTVEIHDLTKKKTKVSEFGKADQPLLDEAMGKTVKGRNAQDAALDEVKTRLDLNQQNQYRVVDQNGSRQIEIDAGPECNPGKILIGSDAAR
jgi:hypothetical protein